MIHQEMECILRVLNKMFDETNMDYYVCSILFPMTHNTNVMINQINQLSVAPRRNKGKSYVPSSLRNQTMEWIQPIIKMENTRKKPQCRRLNTVVNNGNMLPLNNIFLSTSSSSSSTHTRRRKRNKNHSMINERLFKPFVSYVHPPPRQKAVKPQKQVKGQPRIKKPYPPPNPST